MKTFKLIPENHCLSTFSTTGQPLTSRDIFIMEEIWKDIDGFEDRYQVSNLGRVRSIDRIVNNNGGSQKIKGKVLNQYVHYRGYFKVRLSKNNKAKNYSVHRLMAKAFILNPLNKPHINHINGIKNDNNISNLEWVTHAENIQHAWDNGLHFVTEKMMKQFKRKNKSKNK